MDNERKKKVEKLAEQLRETQRIQHESVLNKHYSYEFKEDGVILVTDVTFTIDGNIISSTGADK